MSSTEERYDIPDVLFPSGTMIGSYRLVSQYESTPGNKVFFATKSENPNQYEKYIVTIRNIGEKSQRKLFKQQLKIVKMFADNPHIIKYLEHGMTPNPQYSYIVTNYYDSGDIFDHVSRKRIKDVNFVKAIIYQVLLALKALSEKNIIHNLVTPANIIIEDEQSTKALLSGFKFAQILPPGETTSTNVDGCYQYMPPDKLRGLPYDVSSDMWALGITVYVIFARKLPFHIDHKVDVSQRNVLDKILANRLEFDHRAFYSISETCIDFIQRLLEKDHRYRMTIPEALHHPWFDDLDPSFKEE